MKSLVFIFLMLTSVLAFADTDISFPDEISELLSSPEYSAIVEKARLAVPSGMVLRVTGASTLLIGNKQFVYVSLNKLILRFGARQSEYIALGEVVGEVKRYPSSGPRVENIYFEPAAERPVRKRMSHVNRWPNDP